MIAADTSSMVAYFAGESGDDIDKLAAALAAGNLILPPVVVTEILSDPAASEILDVEVPLILTLTLHDGHWIRAGHLRRALHRKRLKAKIADALIAQSCLDHDVALITRDKDFRNFAKHCGLRLA
jgi:predicted nucleic acid-binding protein